ncbi:MAG: beta-lactamase family protein [Candidatus Aminicenantes bacterium]|nr:beta-lactamase family protein [Candidatus Aminicenantes bacterium]
MAFLKKKRTILGIVVLILALAAAFLFVKLDLATQLRIGAGWKAQILCSGVFVSGRDAAALLREDVPVHPLLSLIGAKVDYEKKEVRASFLGLIKNRAIYHPRLGSILLSGASEDSVRSWPVDIPELQPVHPESVPWPTGDLVPQAPLPPGVDGLLLDRAVDDAFAEPDPKSPRRTRAVLIVHNGQIVAERYAPGITPEMPLIGWSMTKSVTSALVGILVGEGKLSLPAPAPVPEWTNPDDPRRKITLEQLLWMSSGLSFSETYAEKPISDVQLMLFTTPDAAAYAARLPLDVEPGTKWHYSTGTTAIIARIIRGTFNDERAYYAFPRRALLNRIGMRSAVFETDASGTFDGSAYLYASARDWARLGLLYLNDGVWGGERIFPEGWVVYSTTPAPTAEKGDYGAHIWLNAGPRGRPEARPFPELPQDLYYFEGYQGQFVGIVPSRRLVLVRLGMQTKGEWDKIEFLTSLMKAIQE